jgi:hypothetical protein
MLSENVFGDVGSYKRLVLLIKRLPHRGDTGVTDARATLLATLGAGLTHQVNNTHCETGISETDF